MVRLLSKLLIGLGACVEKSAALFCSRYHRDHPIRRWWHDRQMTRRNDRFLTCRLGALSMVTVAHSLIPVKPFHTLSNNAANALMGPLADIPGIGRKITATSAQARRRNVN